MKSTDEVMKFVENKKNVLTDYCHLVRASRSGLSSSRLIIWILGAHS